MLAATRDVMNSTVPLPDHHRISKCIIFLSLPHSNLKKRKKRRKKKHKKKQPPPPPPPPPNNNSLLVYCFEKDESCKTFNTFSHVVLSTLTCFEPAKTSPAPTETAVQQHPSKCEKKKHKVMECMCFQNRN